MKKISFTKMVAAGNDFIVIDQKINGSIPGLARKICDRKFGAGADGLLLLSKREGSSLNMRIFNADGSEAEMCGNGARCAALFHAKNKTKIFTQAGIINAEVKNKRVRIQIASPGDLKLDIPLNVYGRDIKIHFINTGVPHAVIFVSDIENINVRQIGRFIRYHKKFAPRGTNVDFAEAIKDDLIKVRTYERGVEDETLACGTGSTASALVFAIKNKVNNLVHVATQSKETLKVYFDRQDNLFTNVWLEGSARIVYKGEYYV